jgi:hypothetical protein
MLHCQLAWGDVIHCLEAFPATVSDVHAAVWRALPASNGFASGHRRINVTLVARLPVPDTSPTNIQNEAVTEDFVEVELARWVLRVGELGCRLEGAHGPEHLAVSDAEVVTAVAAAIAHWRHPPGTRLFLVEADRWDTVFLAEEWGEAAQVVAPASCSGELALLARNAGYVLV